MYVTFKVRCFSLTKWVSYSLASGIAAAIKQQSLGLVNEGTLVRKVVDTLLLDLVSYACR